MHEFVGGKRKERKGFWGRIGGPSTTWATYEGKGGRDQLNDVKKSNFWPLESVVRAFQRRWSSWRTNTFNACINNFLFFFFFLKIQLYTHEPNIIINKSSCNYGPVCLQESEFLWESEFRGKWIPRKWIPGKYFPMFGSVMENELENTLQCLVMLWKMNWKIIYWWINFFFKFI